jgi:hypothetical protein
MAAFCCPGPAGGMAAFCCPIPVGAAGPAMPGDGMGAWGRLGSAGCSGDRPWDSGCAGGIAGGGRVPAWSAGLPGAPAGAEPPKPPGIGGGAEPGCASRAERANRGASSGLFCWL